MTTDEHAAVDAPTGKRLRFPNRAAYLIAAAVVLAMVFPGDVPIQPDQQSLLISAANANAAHRLADYGLSGTYAYTYGPLPTQLYQLLLLLSHDLRLVIALRSAIVALTIAAALWSLGATLNLRREFVALVLACPWVWYFCRDPWDNTFCIPLSCIMLAAYARWLVKPARGSAILSAACGAALPLVHLSAIALPLAILGHAIFRRWKSFRTSLPWIAVGVILACSTNGKYIWMTSQQMMQRIDLHLAGYPTTPAPGYEKTMNPTSRPTAWKSASFILRAGVLLSADQSVVQVQPDELARAFHVLRIVARGVYLWIVVGIVVVCRRKNAASGSLGMIAMISLLILCIEFASMRTDFYPHYFVGVFAGVVLLAWIGVVALWQKPALRWLVILPAICDVAATLILGFTMHTQAPASPDHWRRIEDLLRANQTTSAASAVDITPAQRCAYTG
jgi:hypothetical protein